jgi:hypothetical protein
VGPPGAAAACGTAENIVGPLRPDDAFETYKNIFKYRVNYNEQNCFSSYFVVLLMSHEVSANSAFSRYLPVQATQATGLPRNTLKKLCIKLATLNLPFTVQWSAKREEVKAGSEKSEVCHAEAFPQKGTADFVSCAPGHFSL